MIELDGFGVVTLGITSVVRIAYVLLIISWNTDMWTGGMRSIKDVLHAVQHVLCPLNPLHRLALLHQMQYAPQIYVLDSI
jgi:hypothetical protein